MITMILLGKPDLSDLTEDGDTTDLDENFALRLNVVPDQSTSINDFDCYGRIYEGHLRTNSYGYEERPEDFNGAARKVGRHVDVWWQPWEGATDEEIQKFLPTLNDLLEYGFKMVVVTLVQKVKDVTDYVHEVDVESAALGGIDSLDSYVNVHGDSGDYLSEIVADLWSDIFDMMAKR